MSYEDHLRMTGKKEKKNITEAYKQSNDNFGGLYAQLHYFLNFSQLLVSCPPLLDKLINSGVSDLSSHGNNNQTHLN